MKFVSNWSRECCNPFSKLCRWSIPEILLKKTYPTGSFLFVFQHWVFKDLWKGFTFSNSWQQHIEIYSKPYTLVSLSSRDNQSFWEVISLSHLSILGWVALLSVKACLFLLVKIIAQRYYVFIIISNMDISTFLMFKQIPLFMLLYTMDLILWLCTGPK